MRNEILDWGGVLVENMGYILSHNLQGHLGAFGALAVFSKIRFKYIFHNAGFALLT